MIAHLHHRLETLGNGLRVLVAPQPHLHTTHLQLRVHVGPVYETPADNGLSHYLEHAVHRSTRRLDAHGLTLAFDDAGGDLDASTACDSSRFDLDVAPDSLSRAADLLAEMLGGSTFAQVEVERSRVLIEMDEEGEVDAERVRRHVYPAHPLGQPIFGARERVLGFTLADLERWHRLHYVAANALLVVTGAVTEAEALRVAQRSFGRMPSGARVVGPSTPQPQEHWRLIDGRDPEDEDDEQDENEDEKDDTEVTPLDMCFRTFAVTDARRPAMVVLEELLDGSASARLIHRLCDDEGVCYTPEAARLELTADGYLAISAPTRPRLVPRVARLVLGMLSDLAREGSRPEEIERAKRRIMRSANALRDSAEGAAELFAEQLQFDLPPSLEEHVAALLRVTVEDVREVAEVVVRPERLTVLASVETDEDEARLRDVVEEWCGAGGQR